MRSEQLPRNGRRLVRLVVTVEVSPHHTTTATDIASEVQSALEWDDHLGLDSVLVEVAREWQDIPV